MRYLYSSYWNLSLRLPEFGSIVCIASPSPALIRNTTLGYTDSSSSRRRIYWMSTAVPCHNIQGGRFSCLPYRSIFSIKLMLGNILLDQPPWPVPLRLAPSFPVFLASSQTASPLAGPPLLASQKIYLFPKPVADHSAFASPLLRSLLALAPLFLWGCSLPPPSPAVWGVEHLPVCAPFTFQLSLPRRFCFPHPGLSSPTSSVESRTSDRGWIWCIALCL